MMQGGLIQPNMRVAVLGFGLSGQAAMEFALAAGASVRVSDSGDQAKFAARHGARLDALGLPWEAGRHTDQFLANIDAAIISPGVSLHQSAMKTLRNRGVPCYGELALAAPLLAAPVVAVTGTNGKTTVTTLIGEILTAAGKKVFVGGNIGTPLLRHILAGQRVDVIVLELSSFQLQLAGDFAPQIGVLLNITPDHFDLHADMAEYAAAKMRLFARQKKDDTAVICLDDPVAASLTAAIPSRLVGYGSQTDNQNCQVILQPHMVRYSQRGREEVYDLSGSALDFPIGLSNGAAAIGATRAFGIEAETILTTLRAFTPLPHRLQLVRRLNGVRYVDDSKGTNTGAVIAALRQTPGRVALIAGGRHKGEDYRLLREAVAAHCRHLILIGEAAPLLAEALTGFAPITIAGDMGEATRIAAALAEPGDTVLLSPACSSFDMFKDYAERGQRFAAAVQALPGGTR
ncbi:MAG: UDP-N-acetylmuramoyl-L-alanine--D-glutamate ligase [Desulfobulbaceae bacterium]|jgi:UDP-N-acetylmuramoylalanine--D-glutamate ligase|nr:UDP-N-acetylmuramoyl-L-alanine--D-glutamate ligase [Desulfobulbaceae bacterium]